MKSDLFGIQNGKLRRFFLKIDLKIWIFNYKCFLTDKKFFIQKFLEIFGKQNESYPFSISFLQNPKLDIAI